MVYVSHQAIFSTAPQVRNTMQCDRREFLREVSSGMLVAGLGASLATDLGISPAFADDDAGSLDFGDLRPLVGLMQDTPARKLQPQLIRMLKDGSTSLKQLTAAAALANAETFGGTDYVGYHTEMALLPALSMAGDLPSQRQALPVLKVLYRNAARIQSSGQSKQKTLHPVASGELPQGQPQGEALREAVRAIDLRRAETMFAAQVKQSPQDAFNAALWTVQDNGNVHRFCLAYRAWGLLDVVGQEHAHTMLRQCVRYCVDTEAEIKRRNGHVPYRQRVPKLLDQYKLMGKKLGTRSADDAWLDEMSQFIFSHTGEESMDAVAAALADGFSPDDVHQAIALAANQLVLRQDRLGRDSWRSHGATPGVHASDAANAWRNMARVSDHRNTIVGILVSAQHTGGSRSFSSGEPYPLDAHQQLVTATDAAGLLQEAEAAITANDQPRATAAVHRYGELGFAASPVFELLLRYSVSEDGRLHAEKYYQTVVEEFAVTRPAFRWRHLAGLARVTASSYGFDAEDRAGFRAPGYEDACRLLGVEA